MTFPAREAYRWRIKWSHLWTQRSELSDLSKPESNMMALGWLEDPINPSGVGVNCEGMSLTSSPLVRGERTNSLSWLVAMDEGHLTWSRWAKSVAVVMDEGTQAGRCQAAMSEVNVLAAGHTQTAQRVTDGPVMDSQEKRSRDRNIRDRG